MTKRKASAATENDPGAFQQIAQEYSLSVWRARHNRSWTWMGAAIEQMPDDLMRIQELIFHLKPTVIIETGVQFGGSVLFYASLLHLIHEEAEWQVIGIDNKLLQEVQVAVERCGMARKIVLIEGNSITPQTIERVKRQAYPGWHTMVILDSDHRYAHVLAEMEAYAPLVTVGSYLIVCDTIQAEMTDENEAWDTDNPVRAIADFLKGHPEFVQETPARPHDRSEAYGEASHWPNGYLRRLPDA